MSPIAGDADMTESLRINMRVPAPSVSEPSCQRVALTRHYG
jgi:hypothetical protein